MESRCVMETNEEFSQANSKKLDRILQILEGIPEQPGLLATVREHETILKGHEGSGGLVSRVAIMWRIHWAVGSSISTLIGVVGKCVWDAYHKHTCRPRRLAC